MAKLNESVLVVKVSELLRDDQPTTPVLNQENLEQFRLVLEELAGPGKLVEIITDGQTDESNITE